MQEVKKAVQGKDRCLLWMLSAIVAGGHILLEDIPGVGKTTMALAFSRALGLNYGRVQFTPDVLPSDITGYTLYNKETGKMTYQPGAILCNLFLADELNRATSRTQSALLEAMEEGAVTVDGTRHHLPRPFTVIATQNPTGAAGSQMDRFMIRMSVGYPNPEAEREMVLRRQKGNPLEQILQVLTREDVAQMQAEAAQVYISPELVDYMIRLITATRTHPNILRGASPRATIAVTAMSRALAYLQRRDYVLPEDIQAVFPEVVDHRLLLPGDAAARGIQSKDLLAGILRNVPAPKLTHGA